jgi:hypothetical protein
VVVANAIRSDLAADLDFDFARQDLFGLGQRNDQQSVLEPGSDFVAIDFGREFKGTLELAMLSFAAMASLRGFVVDNFLFAADLQRLVDELDRDVFQANAGQFHVDNKARIGFQDVTRRVEMARGAVRFAKDLIEKVLQFVGCAGKSVARALHLHIVSP